MADTCSPAVRALLDDPHQIPPELTLFFHNEKWTDLVPEYDGRGGWKNASIGGSQETCWRGGSSNSNSSSSNQLVPLIQRIRDRHAGALKDLTGFASAWDALEAAMKKTGDGARWAGVQARFKQQVNDAVVFATIIMDYYRTLSGLRADSLDNNFIVV